MTPTPTFFQGSGMGLLTYAIDGQPLVKAGCSFRADENETGSLDLEITVDDAARGASTIAIEVSGYSPAQYLYPTSGVTVSVKLQTAAGNWISHGPSPGSLFIRNVSQNPAAPVYAGSLNVANLEWQGTGDRPPISLRLGWFFLSAAPGDAAALNPDGTDGWATITCEVGTDTPPATFTDAGVWLSFGTSLSFAATWNDSVYGSLYVLVLMNSSTTGIYDSSQTSVTASVTPFNIPGNDSGNLSSWSNNNSPYLTPGVVVNVISTLMNSTALTQASISIQQLPWLHADSIPDQPGLNLTMSVFANVPN